MFVVINYLAVYTPPSTVLLVNKDGVYNDLIHDAHDTKEIILISVVHGVVMAVFTKEPGHILICNSGTATTI